MLYSYGPPRVPGRAVLLKIAVFLVGPSLLFGSIPGISSTDYCVHCFSAINILFLRRFCSSWSFLQTVSMLQSASGTPSGTCVFCSQSGAVLLQRGETAPDNTGARLNRLIRLGFLRPCSQYIDQTLLCRMKFKDGSHCRAGLFMVSFLCPDMTSTFFSLKKLEGKYSCEHLLAAACCRTLVRESAQAR